MSVYLYILNKAKRTVRMDGKPVELREFSYRFCHAGKEYRKRLPGGGTEYIEFYDERHPEQRAMARAEAYLPSEDERPLFTTDGKPCKGMEVYRATLPFNCPGWMDTDKPPAGGECVGELRKVKGRWTVVPTAGMLLRKLTAFHGLNDLYKSMERGYRPTIRDDIDADHTLLRQLLIEQRLCVFPDPTDAELKEAGKTLEQLKSAPTYSR